MLINYIFKRNQHSGLTPFSQGKSHLVATKQIEMSTTVKAIALDLDGTTLDSHHHISSRTAEILRILSARGIYIILATGRSTADVLRYFDHLQLSQQIRPGVSYNGTYGMVASHDAVQCAFVSKTVFHAPHSEVKARQLIEFAAELGLVLQYYNSEIGEVFAVPLNDEHHTLLGRYAALVERPQLLISSYEEAIALSPATKILLMTNDPTTLVREAKNRFVDGDFNVVVGSPHPFFVEFLPPDASKGAGLKAVCEHLQLDIASVVAFGDGDNDKEMLEMAGIGVAMANAKPAAKSAANIVLEWSNDEDGVAQHLEQMEREGLFGPTGN